MLNISGMPFNNVSSVFYCRVEYLQYLIIVICPEEPCTFFVAYRSTNTLPDM